MNTAQLPTLERAVTFSCEDQTLVGVVTTPVQPVGDLGMVIVVGGPQYRAGSHRQFVQQARSAAATGVPTLRFDVRGMGDSEGELRNFEHITPDIAAAIGALLQTCPGVQRVALWGLCDGASAALLYLDDTTQDPRVHALCLLNPWVRSEATLAATHVKHYYGQRLMQREFWAKVMRGQVAGRAVRGLMQNIYAVVRSQSARLRTDRTARAMYPQRMRQAWTNFGGRVILVLSANDYTAKEFLVAWSGDAWASVRTHPGTTSLSVAGADHTFSQLDIQQSMEVECAIWLRTLTKTNHASGIRPVGSAHHHA
jgi:exosortase A-associated hydrolase 1